jgi:hypothetical protein
MLLPIIFRFGSQRMVAKFVYQLLMTELGLRTNRDLSGSGFTSCVMGRHSAVGPSTFGEMARKGQLRHAGNAR